MICKVSVIWYLNIIYEYGIFFGNWCKGVFLFGNWDWYYYFRKVFRLMIMNINVVIGFYLWGMDKVIFDIIWCWSYFKDKMGFIECYFIVICGGNGVIVVW